MPGSRAKSLAGQRSRPVHHLRSIIDNIAEYYRQNPLADRDVGVLVMDSLFADNGEGGSTVSAERMGELAVLR